ncbi:MAG TPA: helix-turn-helix domain-containing protein [Burkholderiaceae bacterium]|nr:helix-turn-helix domain-containing protein [Burkholderiaceae bacterium]
MNDKLEFAQRLQNAMVNVGLQPRPGVLYNLFNTRYWGRSVSFQAVSKWLKGEAIPAQDKLQVLAQILNVEPEVLRFGTAVRDAVYRRRRRWDESIGYLEQETFDAFLRLPPSQRKVLREVILTFVKAHAKTDGATSGPSKPSVPAKE